MPIYEYRCQACNHELEAMQRITADPLELCPRCGNERGLQRLISRTSFILKGSGWYVTDYKKGSHATSSATISEGKNETKSESKSTSDTSSTSSSSSSSD